MSAPLPARAPGAAPAPAARSGGRNKPKAIGTAAETAVVNFLKVSGWPHAERRALHGAVDLGDITGTPLLCWEVKGGEAAKHASVTQIEEWMHETANERVNSGADIGVLVVARRGYGATRAGFWTAYVPLNVVAGVEATFSAHNHVSMLLTSCVDWLRHLGYGGR